MSFLVRAISNIIGIVAPVFQSFKVLKKPTKPKLIECVHYWTVYGSFLIIDWCLNTFFLSCFIPFYDFFILTFTVLVAVPQLGVASALYKKFLAPFLRKYERKIDSIVYNAGEQLWEKMPGVALTAPAILASIVGAFNATMISERSLEFEEMEDSVVNIPAIRHRSVSRSLRSPRVDVPVLNQSFEIQDDDDDDDNDDGDVFRPVFATQVKQEVLEEDEQSDDVAPIIPKRVSQIQTRRQLRARSAI